MGGRRGERGGARAAGVGRRVPRAAAGLREHRGAHRARRRQAGRLHHHTEEGMLVCPLIIIELFLGRYLKNSSPYLSTFG